MSTTATAQPAARKPGPEAITLLHADHKEARYLYTHRHRLVTDETGAAQRGRAAEQMCAALIAHATAQAKSKKSFEPAQAKAPTGNPQVVLRARGARAMGSVGRDAHHRGRPARPGTTTTHRNPLQNRLLAALSPADFQRWLPLLEWVDLPLGHVVYESGITLSHVYFPTTAIVSLLHVLKSGATAECAVAGCEGLVGVPLFMGGGSTSSRAVVQSAGEGFRIKASTIREEFEQSTAVVRLLLRYTQALMTQVTMTAVCNRHHLLDQQLSRWLLLSMDRRRGNDLSMTQETIANMLGVRREGVTESALKLQKAGLIRYARGQIRILDRKGLEQRACECYGVVKREYDRLLPSRVAE